MNILIVGAGPAGLALANFLNTDKHKVTIIERSREFKTMGFGIFFFNEGKRLLRKATHYSSIHKFLRQIGYKKFFNEHGKPYGETHYNELFHVNDYDSITSIKREDLHHLLRKHLSPSVDLRMGTRILTINNMSDGADVCLSDDTRSRYDIVVGCDGAQSDLRSRFFSSETVTLPWTARYFWMNQSMSRFLLEFDKNGIVMCMPHKRQTTMLSIEHNDIFNGQNASNIIPEELREYYEAIGLNMREVERGYRHSYTCPMRYLYTKGWINNSVVLIGDAQHAMTPTLGFGTSTALEDADELAAVMNGADTRSDLNATLPAFARRRSRRIAVLRSINRLADGILLKRSKLYFDFWYVCRYPALKGAQFVEWLVRLGWRYG